VAVSVIAQTTNEGSVRSVSSFVRGGVAYLAWAVQGFGTDWQLQWKSYSGAYFTEVVADTFAAFRNMATILSPVGDILTVVYADAAESSLYCLRFRPTTGARVSGPTRIGPGSRPSLVFRGNLEGDRVEVVYAHSAREGVFVRESLDGGASWSGERPVLSNYVRGSSAVAAAPLDDGHMSLFQIGVDARPLVELGSYSRTRPLSNIVKHPTLADRFFVSEPTWYDSTYFTDHTKGGLRVTRDGTQLVWSDGVRLGADDGVNEVALLDTSGLAPSLVSSVHNSSVDGSLGDNLAFFTISPFAAVGAVDLFGASSVPLVTGFNLSNDYIYVAGSKEVAPRTSGGGIDVVRISDLVTARVVGSSSTIFGHAVGVGVPPSGAAIIAVATQESGQEMVRLYQENGLTPTLLISHKMPAYVNKVMLMLDTASVGDLFVSMVDRFNIYHIEGMTSAMRLVATVPLLSKGSVFQAVPAANGNIVCALGMGGVAVFSPNGGIVAQSVASGISPKTWRGGTTYALNDLVVPTEKSVYAPFRRYFICSTAGTTGQGEPAWCPAAYGTVVDGTARWTEVGPIDAVVTGVALDQTRKRIYAVGNVGGFLGNTGRVYSFDATGLI
jgi:hypothetical protein